jgi:hypothetical protein
MINKQLIKYKAQLHQLGAAYLDIFIRPINYCMQQAAPSAAAAVKCKQVCNKNKFLFFVLFSTAVPLLIL